jgi:hypothetical protein
VKQDSSRQVHIEPDWLGPFHVPSEINLLTVMQAWDHYPALFMRLQVVQEMPEADRFLSSNRS